MSQQAIDYVRAGLALVEIRPGSKAPRAKSWQQSASAITTEEQAAKLPEGTGLGIAHRWCKTCALDVDDLKSAAAWFLLHGLDLEAHLSAPGAVQDVSGREGRAKLIYRLPEGVEWLKTVKPTGSGFELRNATADGLTVQDVVAPSIHPDTGQPYTWRGDWHHIPVIPAPLLAVWQRLVSPRALPMPSGASAPRGEVRTLEEIRDALEYISSDDYDIWVQVGMAMHHNFHGDAVGLDAWDTWSQISKKYQPGCCADKWASFRPDGGTTIAAVFAMAKAQGADVSEMAKKRIAKSQSARVLKSTASTSTASGLSVLASAPHPLMKIVESNGEKREPRRKKLSIVGLWEEVGIPSFNGHPVVNMDTVVRILEHKKHPLGDIYFDTFINNAVIDDDLMTDAHTSQFLLHCQRELDLHKMGKEVVHDGIVHYAHMDMRNCLITWLESLPAWDKTRRLKDFFRVYYGTENTHYTAACGINFFRSLVARALEPGCQQDHMVVLEGAQGIGKSTSLKAICQPQWFAVLHGDIMNKGFMENLQGKWLMEIDEMHAFNRSETSAVKSAISRTSDRFRPPWGRCSKDFPRQTCFVGTTNRDDWNRDDTGARRFWPIKCQFVALEALRLAVPQLFAEALHDIRKQMPYWKMPEAETLAEQQARYDYHPWHELVAQWALGRPGVTTLEVLSQCIKMDIQRITKKEEMVIGSILRNLGWERRRAWQGARRINMWEPPEREPGQD